MDESLKQAIVIRGQFANRAYHPGMNVKAFVSGYMFRADADEPLIIDDHQHDQYLELLKKLNSPDDQHADEILNHRLRYNGIGFDKNKISLTRDEQLQAADAAQLAYDQGHSVKQLVITFDTQWLKDHELLDDEIEEPVKKGDLRGHVDQRRLRTAVQDGLNRMFDQSTMRDPQMAAAIQTDTSKVHVHLAVWDRDRRAVNDHGKILARERDAIRVGIVDSLDAQPTYVNEVDNLQKLARSTQQNARFKRHLLKRELYNSALRLDQVSLYSYVNNLSNYDQKTLTTDQRNQVANSIQTDWQNKGYVTKRSHRLSYGQRHLRRQVHAMIRSANLRKELLRYQKTAGNSKASKDSRVVYHAMASELKHQLTIVEKYRLYQRPRVNAIYANRESELQKRRQDLMDRRADLLPQLNTQPLTKNYVKKLLRSQTLMANLQHQFGKQPLSKTDVYQDLLKAQDDDHHVLMPKTIRAVANNVKQPEHDEIVHELTKNQLINTDTMTPQQRLWLSQYEQDLNDYELDAVSYGGLNVKKMRIASPDDRTLMVPNETHSIYARPSSKHDPDVMGVDFDQIIESGPLKSSVELAVRRNLTLRYQRLSRASQYFEQTHQQNPKWLKEAQQSLDRQYQVLKRTHGPVAKLEPQEETQGYQLDDQPLTELVQKHIQEVDGMQR